MKNCPFKNITCDESCALYINSKELNEMVANRLKSIGVISSDSDGICSIKNMALCQSRYIFENTRVFK